MDLREDKSKSQPGAASIADPIQYREYKLLLKPERFLKEHAFQKFWKHALRVAKEAGVHHLRHERGATRHVREVVFYDTPGFHLYNSHFILRRRTFYRHGAPDTNHELTLKFRHPDREAAAAIDVRPLEPAITTVKFKEEILPHRTEPGEARIIYSHACELATPGVALTQTFGTIAEVFPALRPIGANARVPLEVVSGAIIEETFSDLGKLDFGAKFTAVSRLATWQVRGHQEPLVVEFGYQLKFERLEELRRKPKELSERYFKALQIELADWVQLGVTKTGLTYALSQSPAITNAE